MEISITHRGAHLDLFSKEKLAGVSLPVSVLRRNALAKNYLAGRTSTCMKEPFALTLLTRICVPVSGTITLPIGLAGS